MKQTTFILILFIGGILLCKAQDKLPSVLIKDLNGNSINTGDLSNSGKPFIVSFFALWCKPSIKELNAIHEVYNDWQRETGVKIYVIATDEEDAAAKIKETVNNQHWKYEILWDPDGKFKQAMNVNLIPAVFVFDGNHEIKFSRTGYSDGAEKQLLTEIKKILSSGHE